MPTPTAPELAILETLAYDVDRYLSVCPRTPVFQAQVNGTPPQDSSSGVYYQVTFDNVTLGAYTDVRAGMTVDFGTTPGARDIGSVRVRKTPTSSILYIAGTPPGKLALADNVYLTVRDEYLIWNRQWRLVASASGTAYNNTFTQYKDFDETYSDQNEDMLPIANIVHSVNAEGEWLPVRMAGFNDVGEDYRTVQLTAVGVPMAAGATIAGVLWDIADGTLVDGYELTDTTIEVTFPKSNRHRHIHLTVTDTNGKDGWKPLGIYVEDRDNPPLRNFRVTRDERAEGRDMTLVFFGQPDEADELTIPRRTECVYWEAADFDGDEPPDGYLAQCRAWAIRETTLFKAGEEDEWTLELGGGATWLRNWGGPNDKVTYKASPNAWNFIARLTIDQLVGGYLLGQHSTFTQVCNFKPSGNPDTSREESIDEGKLWEQVVAQAKKITAAPRVDELGGLEIKLHISYMDDDDRGNVPIAAHLTADQWPFESGLALATELQERVGLTEVGGKNWNGSTEGKWLARGPSKTGSGVGGRQDYDTGVILPASGALTRLKWIAGHHWARLNNPRPDVPLVRLGNADHVRPGDVIAITYDDDSLTGETLDDALFLVTRISVAHAQAAGEQDKIITYALEQVTKGREGQEQPIATAPPSPGGNWNYTPPWSAFPGIDIPIGDLSGRVGLVYAGRMGFVLKSGAIALTETFKTPGVSGGPHYIKPTVSGLSGTLCQFVEKAGSNPKAGWFYTATGIYFCSNLTVASPVAYLEFAFRGSTGGRSADFDYINAPGRFGIAIGTYNDGTYETHATNGHDWTPETQIRPQVMTPVGAWCPGAAVSPHIANRAYAGVEEIGGPEGSTSVPPDNSIYKTDNGGVSWTDRGIAYPRGGDDTSPGDVHVPYFSNASDDILFFGARETASGGGAFASVGRHLIRSEGTTPVVISPVSGGQSFGPDPTRSRWQLSTPSGSNRMIACVTNAARTASGVWMTGDNRAASVSWDVLIAPSSGNTIKRGALLDPTGAEAILFGLGGDIFYWDGSSLDDRSGDLVADPSDEIIGVFGW